jgi:hypothetical protein
MNSHFFSIAFASIALFLAGCAESDSCITIEDIEYCDDGSGGASSPPASNGSPSRPSNNDGAVAPTETSGLSDFVDEVIVFGAAMDEEYNVLGGPCEGDGLCYVGHLYLDSYVGEYFIDAHVLVYERGDIVDAVSLCDSGEWGQDGADLWFISEVDEVEWAAETVFDGEAIVIGPLVGLVTYDYEGPAECEVAFPIFGF